MAGEGKTKPIIAITDSSNLMLDQVMVEYCVMNKN